MTLSGKFGIFRRKLPADMPRQQLMLVQACYIAGAQAAFQILTGASEPGVTAEQAVSIWADLQQEIMDNGKFAKTVTDAEEKPEEEKLVKLVTM